MQATWRSNLVLVIVSVALALGACELLLRMMEPQFDASFYTSDPITGWALRPYAEGWHVSEGHAYVRINSDGMHDREYEPTKPAGTYRLAVLGDSMIAAVQVEREQHLGRFMERVLTQCGLPGVDRVEVMNFGVPGFGTAQELLTLRHKVLEYDPDAVLLTIYTYNDIQNNHRALNPVGGSRAPYFLLEGDELVPDNSFQDNGGTVQWLRDRYGNLANRSRVIQLLAEGVVRRLIYARQLDAERSVVVSEFGDEADRLTYRPPSSPEMQEAWGVTEALILEMDRLARARGIQFFAATLTLDFQHAPDPALREARGPRMGFEDPSYPDRRLEGFARQNDIPFLVLAPLVLREAVQEDVMISFDGGGHYNEAGHRIVGTLLGTWLCAEMAGG